MYASHSISNDMEKMTHRIARRVSIRYLVSMRLWKSMATSRLALGSDQWDDFWAMTAFQERDQIQNLPRDDSDTNDVTSTRHL